MGARSIRQKILMAFGVTYAGAVVLLYFVGQGVLLKGFESIERELAVNGARRVQNALEEDLKVLLSTCGDWSAWDDTRDFVLGKKPEYVEQNLNAPSLATLNLNFLSLYDNDRSSFFHLNVDIETLLPEAPSEDLIAALSSTPALFAHNSPTSGKAGLLRLARGMALVAARPVTNNEQGPDIYGTLIIGRYLSESQIARISERTHQKLRIWEFGSSALGAKIPELDLGDTVDDNIAVLELDNNTVASFTTINDIQEEPALLLEVEFPRTVWKQGQKTTEVFTGILLGAGAVALLTLIFTIERAVLRPVAALARHVRSIQEHKDLTSRLEPQSPDEVGTLTTDINAMVQSLYEAQERLNAVHEELLVTARAAGKSEVASGVLHNVGNVMNSVNITASSLRNIIQRSKISGLERAMEMLDAHREELGTFLSEDEKGQKLPAYITGVARHLTAEKQEALATCEQLMNHIRHTIEIIGLQQAYARNVAVVEPVHLSELIDDAIQINAAALHHHGVVVEQDMVPIPPIRCDRHQVLQILVNLISNAAYAMDETSQSHLRVVVSVRQPSENVISIEVSDNGRGIAQEHLKKVFTYGFTTREDGHGIGLHTAALTAQQLGGSLHAMSDGPGLGATFRLELPIGE